MPSQSPASPTTPFPTDLPNSSSLWHQSEIRLLCSTPHLFVRELLVHSPLCRQGRPWVVVHRKPAVVIVPRLPDGRFLLIRQERPPVAREMWEFPAGQVDESPSAQALEETAYRELLEETGYRCPGPLKRLGSFFSSPGFTDENQTVFLAENVVPNHGKPDEEEHISAISFFTLEELGLAVRDNLICDANTLVAYALLISQ